MTEIEKMQKYIKRTKIQMSGRYDLTSKDALALGREKDTIDAIIIAFLYGRAKGYRAAKTEVRG